MAAAHWSYETPQPWEERQGTLVDRVVRVSVEAQRIYAQQEALLPTIHHDHTVDPAIGDHLADVGKRIQILHENARKPDKKALAIAQKQSHDKRVIPSRFPDQTDSDDEEDNDDNADILRGRIETMLMDQEWDTRTWNAAKIRVAVETLYDQIEQSDDLRRRELATTMLIRLLETHESAVDFVESTIPILMNSAFRSLSIIVDTTRIFRMCTLLSVLAEWFTPILSRDNAMVKSMAFLLRESELCARIVQHHWRGVLLERSFLTRLDIDASVRARLRSMHLIQNVELRHQFRQWRDVVGPTGLPIEVLQAYVKILFHLVKPTLSAVDKNRSHVALADQKRLLGSGMLVVLASLIPTDMMRVPVDQRSARRAITEYVKGIALTLIEACGHEADKIVAILRSNIIQRVTNDLTQQLQQPSNVAAPLVRTCLQVIAAATKAVWQFYHSHTTSATDATEASFLMRQIHGVAIKFLATSQVMTTMLRVLPVARTWKDLQICELVLSTLRYLSGSFGFKALLDALTSNGGRALEQVVLCFEWDTYPNVVRAAVAFFHDMTYYPDARAGFTTAGAALLFTKWCDGDIVASKNKPRFVLALCGLALLARQQSPPKVWNEHASSGNLLNSLGSLETRVEALYAILLELVSGSSRDTQASATYLHQTTGVFQSILLRFLMQVKPSDMEPAFQTRKQRSISCIVLSRFFKVPAVAAAAFSETTVIHIALSLQCNRLDEVEGKLRRSHCTPDERRLHYLGLKEACKALSRLARCPSGPEADVSLRPSITSPTVPLLPQAIVCDVILRMHVLEDILPLIHVPTDAAEFVDIDTAMVHAAIELIGYLRPMPYGDSVRQQFLKATASHVHGHYANEKLETLVKIAAPMILHVLREKMCGRDLVATCCSALSRLAATNSCRTLLLQQGALFIALTHVPEVLYDHETMKKPQHSSGSPVKVDANVDDPGLLDVPASLFTLFGRLSAIAEGRNAMFKAQVLPRVLKRLQLTDSKRRDHDLDVKCEIAMVIQRLAMCNAVEGNTSEVFLHFHVIELLTQIVGDHTNDVSSVFRSPSKPSRTMSQRPWRFVLNNVVGAIAALAQDVLVCVPTIVKLDVLNRLVPLLARGDTSQDNQQQHIAKLHYHIVNIAHAIATFPFGEYHGYLKRIRSPGPHSPHDANTLLDHVKHIAFDFTLELQGNESSDQPSIGEMARDILALIRELSMSGERQQSATRASMLPTTPSPSRSRPASPQVAVSSREGGTRGMMNESVDPMVAFPALSPKRDVRTGVSIGRIETPGKREGVRLPSASPRTPSRENTVVPTLGSVLPGLDLLSTRPPPKPTNPPPVEPPYIFARPKDKQRKHTRRRDETDQFLMLDPLFQNSPTSHQRRHRGRDSSTEGNRDEDGYFYVQEIAREGHQVNLRARRSRAGDKYIPSLGQLIVEDPTMNVLRRR